MQPDEDILELEEKEEKAALAVSVKINRLHFIFSTYEMRAFSYFLTTFFCVVTSSVLF